MNSRSGHNAGHSHSTVRPADVHTVIGQHLLADGLPIVLDLQKSQGRRLYDSRSSRSYLDMFSCFASWPIGMNHPKMFEPEFLHRLTAAALTNPTNSDVYTVEMAEFVQTWTRLAMPEYLPHLFFISGGAVAVENALKTAFDWKVRKNFRQGSARELGHQVIHLTGAFHGRSGYTLSLTNTADPRKYQYFTKIDWPRVSAPVLRFPIDEEELERIKGEEAFSLEEMKSAFRVHGDDIACIIIEPIQGEGGDNHFRPEFLRALRQLADDNEALLIFDEIQTGLGLTGRMWAHQHHDIRPDIVVFGKKSQVCGIMVGSKIDTEPDNVFRVSSRLNSTLGGNLADMVRCQRYLEIMTEENLVVNAEVVGWELKRQLQMLAASYPRFLSNARGLGLMCAVNFPDSQTRDQVVKRCFDLGMIILPCGQRSIRFRPALDVTVSEIQEAADILNQTITQHLNR